MCLIPLLPYPSHQRGMRPTFKSWGVNGSNVGSLAAIVGLHLGLLAPNVSPKHPLFAGPGAAVCRALQLGY